MERAADWLESCQNDDGGWGESCDTYDRPSGRGQGASTASQTAWGIMGLLACGRAASTPVHLGVRYLADGQVGSGGWPEDLFTGTGFPRAFYLRYEMYPLYFPLIALSRYLERIGRPPACGSARKAPAAADPSDSGSSMTREERRLAETPPGRRILLLPHCLRRSAHCRAKYNREGLQCVGCRPDCPVNRLRTAASELGYGGVCVSPGGRLAVRYVKEIRPEAIVAVACPQELEEGMEAVSRLSNGRNSAPVVVVVPLLKDGCVDTEVDVEAAIGKLSLGCAGQHDRR